MTFLKQWTMCVCVTLVIAVVFSLFTPKGNMKKFYRILISLFVFISFLYPLKDVQRFDFSIPFNQEELFENERLAPFENEVNSQIKKLLKENGITGAVVSSNLSFKDDSSLSIDEVRISIPDEYGKKETERLVFEKLGIKAKVINSGE